jgi:OFA family oxalate/formate antiporter-like MFS transporter
LWGNIAQYITSYLRINEPTLTLELTLLIFPIMGLIQAMFNPFGAQMQRTYNPKLLIGIGCATAIGGVFITSFCDMFVLYIIFYSIPLAMGIGFAYMVPVICGFEWLPHKRGLVSGIIFSGYGFGNCIY